MDIRFRRSILRSSFILSFILFTAVLCPGQTKPVSGLHNNTPNVVAFKNASIIVSPGQILEKATLIIRNNHIESVGSNVAIPPDAVVKDVSGKTIYPGFIDLFSNYGITQGAPGAPQVAPAPSSTLRQTSGPLHWNAAVTPEMRAVELFHPDENSAKNFRKIGITTVVTSFPEGIFQGSGALVLTGDTEPNQAILIEDAVQILSFSKGRLTRSRDVDSYPNSIMGSIALIRQTFFDARWYQEAWIAYRSESAGQTAPETNLSLAALQPYVNGQKPLLLETSDELDILRADKIAREFGIELWVRGNGYEYRRLDAIKSAGLKLILPVNFPEAPDVSTPEKETDVNLRALRHWDFAPENPLRLSDAKIEFALTTATLKNTDDFLKNIRLAVERGLPPHKALLALTSLPAQWLKMSHLLGNLETGKIANFIITDGDIFSDKTKILETYVAGKRYEITTLPEADIRGIYALKMSTDTRIDTGSIVISGELIKPEVKISLNKNAIKALNIALDKRLLSFSFPADSLGYTGIARMTGIIENKIFSGNGSWGDGKPFSYTSELREAWQPKPDTAKTEIIRAAEFPIVYPEGAFGRISVPLQPNIILIKNTTIWTCGNDGILENADLLVNKGKIISVGRNLTAPDGALIINAAGKHVSPGIIDTHSHLAISDGVNEGTHAITSEVRIEDVINCNDVNIYRQLAGGVTMAVLVHGSANPIGGQFSVAKLRWGVLPGEMIFDSAKPGIKFALGENVKQSNWGDQFTSRYPQTRMGTEQLYRDAFQAAKDYRHEWQDYLMKKREEKNCIPPRKDLRLEPLLEILDGKMQIHCHGYRQDELLAILRVAEEIGFKIDIFIHILEGYKVADALKRHGAMPTTFADWWGYKFEAFDAIPYNGGLMFNQGLLVSFNSDDTELARHLNTEAAKAVKYGNVPPLEALKFVTLNPAKQLCIDNQVGSLEPGKDADFVIWNGSPLSAFSICEQTWIDGRKYFDREEDKELRRKAVEEKTALVQKILQKK